MRQPDITIETRLVSDGDYFSLQMRVRETGQTPLSIGCPSWVADEQTQEITALAALAIARTIERL